mmetsp:Transcript_58153/g.142180  ORF Transcript_58153/g.142180 Transcript_58153/m.142180 type:complete len:87 (+) Transcript_58153:1131-1391(+)
MTEEADAIQQRLPSYRVSDKSSSSATYASMNEETSKRIMLAHYCDVNCQRCDWKFMHKKTYHHPQYLCTHVPAYESYGGLSWGDTG